MKLHQTQTRNLNFVRIFLIVMALILCLQFFTNHSSISTASEEAPVSQKKQKELNEKKESTQKS